MLDLIASYLVRGLNIFLHFMPIGSTLWLGGRFGALLYYLSGKRNRIAYSNLKAAFEGEKSTGELRRITKSVYRNMGQTFAELASMTKADKRYIDKYVNIINFERAQKASSNPKGMILLSAHFGDWELATIASVIKGFPLYLLSRDQKMKRTGELLNVLRESKGNIVIRKGMDIKKIFRVLHEGKNLGILGDQNAGVHGELIDFFGRPASTAVGPFRFAQKSGAWILPAFIHRVNGPYQDLILEPIMEIGKNEDIALYMREYNRLLEKHIRANPGQWLWMHKRWKVTPLKKILVLDDGKKGHLKQSLAVVKQIRRYRKDKGFSPEHTRVDTAGIRFKNKGSKVAFNCLIPVLSTWFGMHLKCLKWALTPESYEAVSGRYADVIVSCGSTLLGVNIALKMENNARNVTVLDPGILNRDKFDIVVMPRHDAGKNSSEKDNVVVTEMAPNLIDPASLAGFRPANAGDKTAVGLLIGGDNTYFTFTEDLVDKVVVNVRNSLEQIDGEVYFTTSRRTPAPCEAACREAFERSPRCGMFVSGRDDHDEHTVEKILAASDTVIVSGESISMVSEAVSSGKTVLVFMPNKRKEGLTKYERFVEELRERGYLKLVKPADIPDELVHIARKKPKITPPEDNRRIYEKLYKLF